MSGRKGEGKGKGKEGVFLFAICHRDIIEIRDLIVDEWAKESHGNLVLSKVAENNNFSVIKFQALHCFAFWLKLGFSSLLIHEEKENVYNKIDLCCS